MRGFPEPFPVNTVSATEIQKKDSVIQKTPRHGTERARAVHRCSASWQFPDSSSFFLL